jgi:hypothetical protein
MKASSLIANVAQTDALAKLLIERGVITGSEFPPKNARMRIR